LSEEDDYQKCREKTEPLSLEGRGVGERVTVKINTAFTLPLKGISANINRKRLLCHPERQ